MNRKVKGRNQSQCLVGLEVVPFSSSSSTMSSCKLHQLSTLASLPLVISPPSGRSSSPSHPQPLSASLTFQPLVSSLSSFVPPPLASTTPRRSAFLRNNWSCHPSAKTHLFSHSSCTMLSTKQFLKGNSQVFFSWSPLFVFSTRVLVSWSILTWKLIFQNYYRTPRHQGSSQH